MCGIAGSFNYSREGEKIDRVQLERMQRSMYRRGPDGSGIWVGRFQNIGLAHCRLAVIDLTDGASQPMTDREGRATIIFNGEIYNYRELRRGLELENISFCTQSDTEVVLQLYLKYKDRFVDLLRGMFALAIWDEEEKRLLLARDPFGIKPLYWSDMEGRFLFASQVKALRAGGVDNELDSAGVVGFWIWGHVPEPYTTYRHIRSLPPGGLLIAGADRDPEIKSFCNVADILRTTNGDPAAHKGQLPALLTDSVISHLTADVPVGAFLSAGVDSATLCAIALRNGGQPLRTVTLGFSEFKGTANDEVPIAEQVAKRLGTEHQTHWVRRGEFQHALADLLESMDQPTVDGVNTYFVSKVTAETGLKVALSGVGGDEFFGGYPSFSQIPRLVDNLKWAARLPQLGRGFRWVSAPVIRRMTSPKYASLLELGTNYPGAYLLRRGLFMPWELPSFLEPELVREGWRKLGTMDMLEAAVEGQPNSHCKVSALEVGWYLQSRLLRDTDWAGMAHSLEIRTPLVDIELFKGLAPIMHQRQGLVKEDLVSVVRGDLPGALLKRPKSGFNVPIYDWLRVGNDKRYQQRGLRGWAKFIGERFGIAENR